MAVWEWTDIFAKISKGLPDTHKWSITTVGSLPDDEGGWRQFTDKAKVRFECSRCSKTWTSAMGRVIFHYRLKDEGRKKKGQVKIFLPGQSCNRCDAGVFEPPKWYEEERVKVMKNLQKKIKESFYTKGNRPKKLNEGQRSANMSSGHDTKHCQLCRFGKCTYTEKNRGVRVGKNKRNHNYGYKGFGYYADGVGHGYYSDGYGGY